MLPISLKTVDYAARVTAAKLGNRLDAIVVNTLTPRLTFISAFSIVIV